MDWSDYWTLLAQTAIAAVVLSFALAIGIVIITGTTSQNKS